MAPLDVLIEPFTSRTYAVATSTSASVACSYTTLWDATTLLSELREFNDEYLVNTGFLLFASGEPPRLVRKDFLSFFLKTYRKNVLLNDSWPDEPQGGWITPSNWMSKVNDIVRTTFTVKYLDGVMFLADKVLEVCKRVEAEARIDYEAREEGYYAAHLYFTHSAEIPRRDWDTEVVPLQVELQITTQLQDVIRRLTHVY